MTPAFRAPMDTVRDRDDARRRRSEEENPSWETAMTMLWAAIAPSFLMFVAQYEQFRVAQSIFFSHAADYSSGEIPSPTIDLACRLQSIGDSNMNHEKALAALLRRSASPKRATRFSGFAGTWKNEYGSTAQFAVNGSNVTGTYTSQVSGGGAPATGPIVGQASDSVIAFTVLWATQPPSITAWIGQVVNDGGRETLETLWHLTTDISEDPKENWQSTLAGADFFTQVL
jgi:Avidin family